jgi:ribosome modulation factor
VPAPVPPDLGGSLGGWRQGITERSSTNRGSLNSCTPDGRAVWLVGWHRAGLLGLLGVALTLSIMSDPT